jgi:hypothetical protein
MLLSARLTRADSPAGTHPPIYLTKFFRNSGACAVTSLRDGRREVSGIAE